MPKTGDRHRSPRPGRRAHRRALTAVVPATVLATLGVATALTLTVAPAGPAAADARVGTAGASVTDAARVLVPAPPVPDRVIPDLPLPRPVTPAAQETATVTYTCDPTGDPEFGDPANPNHITNKDCPALNAAKEQAQREYLEQVREEVVDDREYTCSDPTSADYGTSACGTDADGDGLMDGGPLDQG
ncbi:MAG: hypothetical protein ABW212_19980 [Pseudonocardia sediminis]